VVPAALRSSRARTACHNREAPRRCTNFSGLFSIRFEMPKYKLGFVALRKNRIL